MGSPTRHVSHRDSTNTSFSRGDPVQLTWNSNLLDCDVEDLSDADFQPEYPGSLPSAEHTRFFLELVKLCLIISDWLDLLRPSRIGHGRGSNLDRNSRALILLAELQQWHKNVPTNLQPPKNSTGFPLWTATLHITYQAAVLRFCTLLPEGADTSYQAATEICNMCEDLDRQDLLGSLWNFGIHEFDLAMVLHARQSNSKDPATSRTGMRNIQRGLPWARKLGRRSAVAQQAQMFYEDLVKKMDKRAERASRGGSGGGGGSGLASTHDASNANVGDDGGADAHSHAHAHLHTHASAHTDSHRARAGTGTAGRAEGSSGYDGAPIQVSPASNANDSEPTEWGPQMYFTDPLFQAQMMGHDGNAWGWDMHYDQAQFQQQQQFPQYQ